MEGWRVRLCQLYQDQDVLSSLQETGAPPVELGLADLAYLWLGWLETTHPTLVEPLQSLCHEMQLEGVDLETTATQLNRLLIEQATQLPLHLKIAGATDTGPGDRTTKTPATPSR